MNHWLLAAELLAAARAAAASRLDRSTASFRAFSSAFFASPASFAKSGIPSSAQKESFPSRLQKDSWKDLTGLGSDPKSGTGNDSPPEKDANPRKDFSRR